MALGPFYPAISGSRGHSGQRWSDPFVPVAHLTINPHPLGLIHGFLSQRWRIRPSPPSTCHMQQQLDGDGMLWFRRCCCMHKVNCFRLVLLLHDKTYTIFPPAWSHMYVSQTWTTKLNLCAITNCFKFIRENLFSEVWRYFVHFPHCFCLEMQMFRYILFVFMLLLLK